MINFDIDIYAFLFDLDGTLILTDDIYFEVWSEILQIYNISLTPEIFKKYIQGNNDIIFRNCLKARWWWNIVEKDTPLEDVNLVWT